MTGKVLSLRRARKQKARDASRAAADANAARHGEAKSARTLREAQVKLEARRLEGHKLTHPGRDNADEPE